MSTSTLSTLLTGSISSAWDYITTIFSPILVFVLVLGVVALIYRKVAHSPRKAF